MFWSQTNIPMIEGVQTTNEFASKVSFIGLLKRVAVGFFQLHNNYSYFLDPNARSPWTGVSQFLPTTHKILQFSNGRSAKPTDFLWYSIEKIATLSEFVPSCFVKALVITYLKLSMFWSHFYIKFIYSEKATKFCEIWTLPSDKYYLLHRVSKLCASK